MKELIIVLMGTMGPSLLEDNLFKTVKMVVDYAKIESLAHGPALPSEVNPGDKF